ncbi:MAG: dienelactone hydrolase family protein [Pseudomonadales bacterium]|nr:dienelactone hydrolase family protein [Pseudomonadales bacterium]NIX07998.1 dienelactone hydrolase family protein [Pseudomonadales bacterium]
MNTFVAHSPGGGPFPVVVFYMDAPGKREELHDMARRLASAGYYVMLPNLYYRRVREFVVTPEARPEMMAHMNSLSNGMACEDTAALLAFAEADPAARGGPAGCVGYCMSGPFAFAAAAAFPDRIAAAASVHGVRLCTDAVDSPHLNAQAVAGELYFACAEHDDWAPPEMIESLDEHLSRAGVRYRIEWYPDTSHGFVFPGRPVYQQAAAERHWERVLDLFRRNL